MADECGFIPALGYTENPEPPPKQKDGKAMSVANLSVCITAYCESVASALTLDPCCAAMARQLGAELVGWLRDSHDVNVRDKGST